METNKTHLTEIFSLLGKHLKNGIPEKIIYTACQSNSWFSAQSIEHAINAICDKMLDRHNIEMWLKDCVISRSSKKIGVIMAGNIPLVGFFDMMCVICSGHECLYKPSGKDTVLINYVVDELLAIDPEIPICRLKDDDQIDAIIATGSDNSAIYFNSKYKGIPMLLRKSMHSAAILTGNEIGTELESLADDIFLYSGLGCRNVCYLLVPENYDISTLLPYFAVGHKHVCQGYENNFKQTRAIYKMNRTDCIYGDFFILKQSDEFPPDKLCCINYKTYHDNSDVVKWIDSKIETLQCIVGKSFLESMPISPVAFGQAQHPSLTDYPDRKNIMDFLNELN